MKFGVLIKNYVNLVGQNFACCWHGSVLEKKNVFPLPKQTKYWSLCLWSWRWQKWLGLFLLENAFLCVSSSGWVFTWFPSPQCLDTLCSLMCNSNNPCEKGTCWFLPLDGGGTESQRQKGDSPKATCCLVQWHPGPAPPKSHEVSQDSFRTSLWAFFIQKIWCFCFSKLQEVTHWPGSMRSAQAGSTAPWPLVDMNGQYMVIVLACDHSTASVWANALAQVWSAFASCQDGVLAPSGKQLRAVPKTHPLGMRRTFTCPASPACSGDSPSSCFAWIFRHHITSFVKCSHGLPREMRTLLDLTLGWDRMWEGTPHGEKTSELWAPLEESDFILMTYKQQNRPNCSNKLLIERRLPWCY